MRFSVRSSVDLPQPDGPMKAVTCFRDIQRDVAQTLKIAIEKIQIADTDFFGGLMGDGTAKGGNDSCSVLLLYGIR